MADTIVNLAVVGPYHNCYTYKVRGADSGNLRPGCRFLVPFGNTLKVGFFINFQTEPVEYRLRYVRERIDTFSPFPQYMVEFCLWVADYYFAGPGEVMAAALPGTGRKRPRLEFAVVDRPALEKSAAAFPEAESLIRRLLRHGAVGENALVGNEKLIAIVNTWLKEGALRSRYRIRETRKKTLGYRLASPPDKTAADMTGTQDILRPDTIYSKEELLREFGFSDYRFDKLVKNAVFEKVLDEGGLADISAYPIRHELPHLPLMDGQKKALDVLLPAVTSGKFEPFLLFGITGSGKTLVYCHAARQAVESGGSVLVMVPEIMLSGLLLSSFAAFFGDRVAVMHSGLTPARRLAIREKIASGDIRVVIGPRSAIFSPLRNPRLIIVDEEHDPSYKQDDPAPRYHARDAAVMLGRMAPCPVILGSASPSIESYHNAQNGRYRLLTLDQRPKSGYAMPKIVTLDMKQEKISGECSFLSFRLKRETEAHIAAGGQVIYYLNRRGFSPRLKCRSCGEVPACPDCGVTLTYHKPGRQLKCHFCDRIQPAPDICPQCQGTEFDYIGAGTQRVEENLSRLFADIKAERIDSDKTASKSGRLILGDFAEEKFSLLVGTQMVTKGLDFPRVTLVGVLSADIGLDMPDFRAAEKSYARLLQVSGRAGRGDREGLVMIQTYYSDHPVITHAAENNYPQFYESLIVDRRQLNYPPFARLVSITLTSEDEKLLEKQALQFRIRLEEHLAGIDNFILLGPAPAPMYKLRGSFRRRLIIKCGSIKKVVNRFRRWEGKEKNFGLSGNVRAIFDIDPVNMM